MPVREMTPAIPIAAVFTLLCSCYLLDQTGWQKTPHFRVIYWDRRGRPPQYLDRKLNQGSVHKEAAGVSPTTAASQPALAGARLLGAYYEGHFLAAQDELVPQTDPSYLRRLLRSMLGVAMLLNRTLVIPAALCNCRGANLTQCDGPPVAPFDCPLREALPAEKWTGKRSTLNELGVVIRPARFMYGAVPDNVRCSHFRVLLPDGMDDSELTFALRSYAAIRWLEVSKAADTFCGWDTRQPGKYPSCRRRCPERPPARPSAACRSPPPFSGTGAITGDFRHR